MRGNFPFLHFFAVILPLYGLGSLQGSEPAAPQRSEFSIHGEDFHYNGRLTYQGRSWKGQRIEGLLLNMRVVQAIVDDLNPATAVRWAYPDTGRWDPERNVTEFIAALPEWRRQGLLAITINIQAGSPEGYSSAQPWQTSGFSPDGSLRPAFAERLGRVLDAADRLGMAVILGYFYFGQDQVLADESAVLRAADVTTNWVLAGGWRNVIVEVANETGHPDYNHMILQPERIHALMRRIQGIQRDGRRLLVGTSCCGGVVPGERIVQASDYLLLHGNGVTDPQVIGKMVRRTRQVPGYRPMPIVFNEDDHEGFDKPDSNFSVAVAHHASWGWFDYRRRGEAQAEGYQSLPVDWRINTPRKRSFFSQLSSIAGPQGQP